MSHSDDAGSRLAAAVTGSRVVTALERVGDRLAEVGQSAQAERLAARGRRIVTDSALYRWLTAEPDPAVIVLDLRETYTVGPFVAVLDRVLALLDAAATSSGAVSVARSLLTEFRAAPVRLVGATVAFGSAMALLVGVVLGALGASSTVTLATLAVAGLAGTRITASWGDLVDSRVGRLVVAALGPPADATVETRSPADPGDSDE